ALLARQTLFPSTTLFRSVGGGSAFLLRNREPRPVRLGRGDTEIPAATRTMLEKVVRDSRQQRRRVQRVQRRARGSAVSQILQRADRKSTRLHSSHVSISY